MNRKLLMGVAATTAALTLAACGNGGNDNSDTDDNGELSGNIVIDGSSTVAPLSEAAAELFMTEHPEVLVSVGTSGTGGGFELFCNGETDGSDASREISEEEAQRCAHNGIAYEAVQVANDAMTVLVHPDNPVDCLTVEQLRQIWGPDSSLTNWDEIDGLDVEFDGDLDLYGPGPDSGTFDYFTEQINGESGAHRTDYNNIGEEDNAGIRGVAGSLGGMFYVGYSYYIENQGSVKALEIDGGNGCQPPSPETIEEYVPLSRPLYVYFSDVALERPEVRQFADFYINRENTRIAEAASYIGMSAEQAAASSARVDSLIGE